MAASRLSPHALTPEQEEERALANYLATKDGKNLRVGDKDVKMTVNVELGVGWSVDPTYAVEKRVLVFCSLGQMWVECDVLAYDEETAAHEFVLVGQDTNLKMPLAAFKVRFPHSVGQAMPPKPDACRVGDVLQRIEKAYNNGVYEVGLHPGVRMGIQKMKEAVWQQSEFLRCNKNAGIVPVSVKEWADKVARDRDEKRLSYKQEHLTKPTLHTKLWTMPRWLESKVHLPGDIVWAAWQKKHWPCLIVSSDQYIDLNDKQGTKLDPSAFTQTTEGLVGVYYFGTHERQFVGARCLTGFAEGVTKGFLRRSKGLKGKREAAVNELVKFLLTGVLPEMLGLVMEEVNAMRLPSSWVNGRQLDPTVVLQDDYDDEEAEYMDIEDKKMVALSFEKEWRPTKAVLDKISTQELGVLRLGEIDSEHPLFHSETHFYPIGYKIRRKLKSNLTEGTKKIVHTIEILNVDKDGRKSEEPVFKVAVNGKEKLFATASSPDMQTFLNNTSIKDARSGMLGRAGGTLLGLNKGSIREAVAMLPGVEKCSKVPRERLEEWRLKFLKQSSSFLLEEMKHCKLPDDIEPVPMTETRPFECQVCGEIEEDEEDLILQCDSCKGCTHMSCYSVTKAPHGNLWLCDVCQVRPAEADRPPCVLCPVKGGLMKRTTEGQWCHPGCAIWIQETHIIADERYLNLEGLIGGVKQISQSRREHRCMFCKQIYGAVIQCCEEGDDHVSECFKTFHLMCAKNNGCELRMEVLDPTWEEAADRPVARAGAGARPSVEEEFEADAEATSHGKDSGRSWARSEQSVQVEDRRLEQQARKEFFFFSKTEASNQTGSSPECPNCGTTKSRKWILDEVGRFLCDDCGVYWHVHKEHRPLGQPPAEPAAKRLPSSGPIKKSKSNKRIRAGKKKKDPPKGVFVGNLHLRCFCPKHSQGYVGPGLGEASDKASPSASLDIEDRAFDVSQCDIHDWLEKNGDRFHKNNVEAHTLAPSGRIPAPDPMRGTSIKRGSEITTKYEGLVSRSFPNDADPGSSKYPRAVIGGCDDNHDTTRTMAEEYVKLCENWRYDVHPGKSAIHGWGAFANRDYKKHEMVIEYVGELVRPSLAEVRETKMYDELVGSGTYVFRLNDEYCVDATRSGNLAHLLNHSCRPNCASRTIRFAMKGQEPRDHVMIYADRDIKKGEEMTYDYRFSGDEILKCSCGAVGCRGKVNLELGLHSNDRSMGTCYVSGNELRRRFKRSRAEGMSG